MSVTTTVFLERSKLPTADAWSRAIRAHGFALELPADVTLQSLDGYLPCTHQGKPAGFECLALSVTQYLAEQEVAAGDPRRRAIGSRDLALSFVTHSDLRDLASATIASAALAQIAGVCAGVTRPASCSHPKRLSIRHGIASGS